jgi:serine phosphatase RsbU (regulator of sigma subunit)
MVSAFGNGTAAAAERAALDVSLAREVQARLLPRRFPHMDTLSYAGVSLPAELVGGDYYDFLDLGLGYLGIAVGDVSGKGLAAALLMANLQAHVRGQCALALEDIACLLRSVNRLFQESTPPGSYATLFFAEYHDVDRRLRYVNCGHPPALLCRRNATVERLGATATVLGLGEDWDCDVVEKQLLPGDRLIVYTDGITEAMNERGEEFGEFRLAGLLRAEPQAPAAGLLESILEGARQFAGQPFRDDVTLVGVRCTQ